MIRRTVSLVALVLVLVLASAVARADDTVQVEAGGKAQGIGKQARASALDVAFARAVQRIVNQTLPAQVRRNRKATIRDEIVRRARLYVSRFVVRDERTVEGETRVQVSVTVNRAKLREAYAELGLDSHANPSGSRPPIVLLLKVSGGQSTLTTFGSTGGEGGAAGRELLRELRAEGFDVKSAAGHRAPLAGDADERLPLGDQAAGELARSAGAGGAVIVGIDAASEGRIRGTAQRGASARAVIRIVDGPAGRVVATADVTGAGYGGDDEEAITAASTLAAQRAMRAVARKIVRHWPPPVASGDRPVVKIRGAKSWAPVAAIIRKLASTTGVDGVHPVRAGGARVDLAIDSTLTASKLAKAVNAARTRRSSVSASVKDGNVLVRVRGARLDPETR